MNLKDLVLVESTVKILPPEDGENVARMTCVSDVSMSLKDTWNTDIPRAEFSETEIGDDKGRLVSVGAELISAINRLKRFNRPFL